MMPELETTPLPIPADLAASSLEQAADMMGGVEPWTYLVCSPSNVEDARNAVKGWNGIVIVIAPTEFFASPDQWLVIGKQKVIWSGRV